MMREGKEYEQVKRKGSEKQNMGGLQNNMPTTASSSLPRSASPSFFKVMIGDFNKLMFIPPGFVQALGGLVDSDALLKDSDGNAWKVQLSVVRDSLAFQRGWGDFVLDHSIEVGEFVVFTQIRRSLFSVRIFGISACERVHFNVKNNCTTFRKRKNQIRSTPENMQRKRCRISEPSERKSYPASNSLVKKERVEKCNCSRIEMIATEFVDKGKKKDLRTSEISPPHHNSYVRRPHTVVRNTDDDDVKPLITSMGFDSEFLVPKEGICYIVHENLMDEVRSSLVTPRNMHVSEKNDSICHVDKAYIPGEIFFNCQNKPDVMPTASILDGTKYGKVNFMSTCEVIKKNAEVKGKAGNALGSGGRAHPNMIDMHAYRKDHAIMAENYWQSGDYIGTMSPSIPSYQKENVTQSLKGKVFEVAQNEIVGLSVKGKTGSLGTTSYTIPSYQKENVTRSLRGKVFEGARNEIMDSSVKGKTCTLGTMSHAIPSSKKKNITQSLKGKVFDGARNEIVDLNVKGKTYSLGTMSYTIPSYQKENVTRSLKGKAFHGVRNEILDLSVKGKKGSLGTMSHTIPCYQKENVTRSFKGKVFEGPQNEIVDLSDY